MVIGVALEIDCIVSMPFAENSYVVRARGGAECFVVDPGFEPEPIVEAISRAKLRVVALLNTHGHVDHIAGNEALKRTFPDASLVIGFGDAPMLTDAQLNLSSLGGFPVVSPPADRTVVEGETLRLLGLEWKVLEIPGHSPGHVVFVCDQVDPPVVLGGDVLFQGSIGRTDFPGGSFEQLAAGIRGKLYPMPAATIVYPGHGDPTTVGAERETNPFVRGP